MDLLETILRSANAEKYVELFAKNGIEAPTLPLLSIEDLKFLGVDEKDVRIEILNKASHLQIPHEKLISIVLTKEDVELILNQITYQLNLHHALLSCPIIRKDVVVCDIKLGNATKCLLNCLESLSNKLDEFEQRVAPDKKTRFHRKTVVFAMGATSVFLFIFGKFCKYF